MRKGVSSSTARVGNKGFLGRKKKKKGGREVLCVKFKLQTIGREFERKSFREISQVLRTDFVLGVKVFIWGREVLRERRTTSVQQKRNGGATHREKEQNERNRNC